MASSNSSHVEDNRSPRRASSWDHKQLAIVYDPLKHELFVEKEEDLNKTYNSFEVHLPRWRNRVNIFVDAENKSGFVASIHLGQLGLSKNLKRRLRYNYTILHVKGSKPKMPSRANTDSTDSFSSQ